MAAPAKTDQPLQRLTLDLGVEIYACLAQLVDETGMASKAEVARRALALYVWLQRHRKEGWNELTLRRADEAITLPLDLL